ncbi:MAG: hypothetical protein Kow00103_11120 [Candidatus Caldatribacteriota bacterium]
MVINDLSQIDGLSCSTRQEIEDYYVNSSLSIQPEMKVRLLKQIAENLGSEKIFFGYYDLSSSEQLILNLKEYDLNQEEVITFRDIKVKENEIFILKEKVINLILQECGVEITSEILALIGSSITDSLEALISYYQSMVMRDQAIAEYQGVDFPSKPLWAQAIEYGEKAVAYDPQFKDAYYLLAEIYQRTHWTIREVESLNNFLALIKDQQKESKRVYEQAAQAYFRLGYSFYSNQRIEQAIDYFKKAVEYNPDLLEAHIYLAQIYYDQEEIGLALQEAERILAIDPQNKDVSWLVKKAEQSSKYGRDAYENYERGYLAYKEADYLQAVNYFQKAIQNNPDYKEPHYYLALCYYYLRDYDSSIRQWKEVIRLDPFDNSAKLYLNKAEEEKRYGRETLSHFDTGYDYYIRGEYEKAVQEFNQSLNFNPAYEKARQFLARAYYQLDQMDKYREEIGKISESKREEEQGKAEDYYKLGYEFYYLKDYDVAIDELKKALNINRNHYAARFLLGECYFQKNEYQLAQTEYEEIVNSKEENEYIDDALLGSGWCFYLRGEYQQAIDRFFRLISNYPKSNLALQATYKLCQSYWKNKDYSRTLEIGNQFLEKFGQEEIPEKTEVLFLIGQAYINLEEFQKGIDILSSLATQYPDFTLINEVRYLECVGWFNLKKYPEATVRLENLLKSNLDDKLRNEASYLLARSYLNNAEFKAAVKILEDLKKNSQLENSIKEKIVYDLGMAYVGEGEIEKAVIEFQEFLVNYSQSPLASAVHFELGQALYQLKKNSLSVEELKKAATPEALYFAGKVAQEMADPEIEISIWKELINKFPENEYSQEAYFKLGNYYYQQNNYLEAIKEFDQMITNYPDSPLLIESYYWMGWSYFRLNDFKKAVDYFKKVEEGKIEEELFSRAQFMVAESLYQLHDFVTAREGYKKFINKYPQAELTVNAQYALAWTYWEERDYSSSLEEFRRLINLYPQSEFVEEAQFRIAKGYFLSEKKEEAQTELRKFIDTRINSIYREEALYLLGQLYLSEEKWMDSIIELERLVREYPESKYYSDALYGLGFSYFKKEEYRKVIELGEKYLKDFANSKFAGDFLYLKAICWEKIGEKEKAIKDYQDLITNYPHNSYAEKARERIEVLQK